MIVDKNKRLFCKGDRVRLTKEGERVLWERPQSRKHRNGTTRSKTGVVVSNSRGSTVSVRFDSDTESKTTQSYGCCYWELIEDCDMQDHKAEDFWRPEQSQKNLAYQMLGVIFDVNSEYDDLAEATSKLISIISKPDVEVSKF